MDEIELCFGKSAEWFIEQCTSFTGLKWINHRRSFPWRAGDVCDCEGVCFVSLGKNFYLHMFLDGKKNVLDNTFSTNNKNKHEGKEYEMNMKWIWNEYEMNIMT